MSFRDVAPSPSSFAMNRTRRRNAPPKIRALSPPKVKVSASQTNLTAEKSAAVRLRPVVSSSDSSSGSISSAAASHRRRKYMKIRRMENEQQQSATKIQNEFSLLVHRTQKFCALVTELESALQKSGESPQMAWKARIMLRSAEESDRDMQDKLYQYKQTVQMSPEADGQTRLSAKKLYRDFQRSHTTLVTAVSLYEKRQVAEVSRLGETGAVIGPGCGHEEDFFDRSMRERQEELERMNISMHKVNEIYQDLTRLIDGQQERIDLLEDHIYDAKNNVESATRNLNWFVDRERICGSSLAFADSLDTNHPSTVRNTVVPMGKECPGLRVSETIHWYTPFETLSEDMVAVKEDVLGFGKNLILNANFKCGSQDIDKDYPD